MLRCKFRVTEITKVDLARLVKLRASNQSDGDNIDWSKYTPSGDLSLTVTNPTAWPQIDALVPGDHCYIDIRPLYETQAKVAG